MNEKQISNSAMLRKSLYLERVEHDKQIREGEATRKVKTLLADHKAGTPIEDTIFEIRNDEATELAFYRLCISKLYGGSIGKAITAIFK